MPDAKVILDSKGFDRALSRLTHEILERNRGAEYVALAGILTGGLPLAKALRDKIRAIEGVEVPVGTVDVTFYRDDVGSAGVKNHLKRTEIPFPIDGRKVVLVDDVLFTGRTIRAAMDALMDFGRPSQIQLAVLVDRGHRELPIRADFVGRNMPTARDERVEVITTGEQSHWKVLLRDAEPKKGAE